MRRLTRRHVVVTSVAVLAAVLLGFLAWAYVAMLWMPGSSYVGALPPLTAEQRPIAEQLRRDIGKLAGEIGERNVEHPDAYHAAADYIAAQFRAAGYEVTRQTFKAHGVECSNIIAERLGTTAPTELVILGAHYDTVRGSPGADDNASGVAALLGIAHAFADRHPQRTVRFVAFANEENPFGTEHLMGSQIYAQRLREQNVNVVAMLAFDGLGYYSDAPNSQRYPKPFNLIYPTTADFVGFVSDLDSAPLLHEVVSSFRRHASFPSEGIAAPQMLRDIGRSDHLSFWQEGYHGVLVTDTLPFRYGQYHKPGDTSDHIGYEALARVTDGLIGVAADLSRTSTAAGEAGNSAKDQAHKKEG